MPDGARVARLEAMGIAVWRLRGRPTAPVPQQAVAGDDGGQLRVRLEAGPGAWLLIVDEASRARFETLLNDVRAALGADRCRFGTWSDSSQSGVAVDEWEAHGIEAAVAFGADRKLPDGFVAAAPLAELAKSAQARRTLWQRLKPVLEG